MHTTAYTHAPHICMHVITGTNIFTKLCTETIVGALSMHSLNEGADALLFYVSHFYIKGVI